MASTSFARKDLTGFILLLACLLLAVYTLQSSGQSGPQTAGIESQQDPSVDNTRSSGSRGLYEWTEKLGYRPRVWRDDFLSLPDSAAVVFCIAPDVGPKAETFREDSEDENGPQPNALTAAEGAAVRRWIGRGHTLVLLASSLPPAQPGDKSSKVDSFSSEIGLQVEDQISMGGAFGNPGRTDYAPAQPSRWTEGVNDIHVHPGAQLERTSDDGEVLFGGAIGVYPRVRSKVAGTPTVRYQPQPVAIVYSIGKGHVVAVADDVFACNANLVRANNAAFLYRVLSLSAPAGSTILFDEFHRTFGRESSSIWSAFGHPLQYGLIQLLLAAIVGLVVLIPRLGRPEPSGRPVGRTSAEYVTSLAGLYRSAGATTTALDTVYRQFLRELCQRYGLPTDITLDRLAETVSRRGGVPVGDLRKLLAGCERALESTPKVSDRDLIVLVRSIERFRKELGIG